MSKYLKLFETTSQYNEYITSIDVVLPNVSVAKDAPLTVYFNPLVHDYSEDYLTLSALEDGTITITIPSVVNATYATYLSYSKDKSNWTPTTIDSTNQTISIPVSDGDDVYFKGKALGWARDYINNWGETYLNALNIGSSADIIVSGNIMSLLYEADFKDKTRFPSGQMYNLGGLFKDNICLINAENLILPAMGLVKGCYYDMFYGCTSLTAAPELPAMTLAQSCYEDMFRLCSSLTAAPELPATTLALSCYRSMFSNCSSLTAAPALPATTLAESCYRTMFSNCSSLTAAPELPATTLALSCYRYMFSDCFSLTAAPALPATTLAGSCYFAMFSSCSKLNSITMLATDISADSCLRDWVSGVASTGTFIKSPSMTSLPTGYSGIPSGWTVLDDSDYLTLSALSDGEITITINWHIDSTYATYLSYSKDKSVWTKVRIIDKDQTISIPVSSGDKVYLKGKAKQWATENHYSKINSNGDIIASGNIMSLLYEDDFKDKIVFQDGAEYIFYQLFEGNTHLISAENLILPATTLAEGCYSSMFYGCSSLTTAPELPATTLAQSCYSRMFYNCTALTTAPALPATTLAPSCYRSLFYNCTSLETTPILPAAVLASSCYEYLFWGCKKLNSISMLATDISADSCLRDWVSGVASTGTFTKAASMTTLPTGTSGIPSGWTVIDK